MFLQGSQQSVISLEASISGVIRELSGCRSGLPGGNFQMQQ